MNIFVAAQRGDVDRIRQLIESGEASATDRDAQNVTALHWAAINAHLAACRYLLEQGAEVDARGGDLDATPMQWAARNGYLYIIHLLISHNADPTLSDGQGYNTLHLATHSSSVMPLLYLLHQPVAVDSPDAESHTALMWAAYQGDAISVDVLLKHGASPHSRDAAGLTPLHWAVVRGNKVCIRRLLEAGAEFNARDANGKTPRDMAEELKSLGAFKRALEEGNFKEDGTKKTKMLSDRQTKWAIFVLPTFFLWLIFKTLSFLTWYTAIPLAAAEFFGMHHIVTRVLLNHNSYTDTVTHSPYFAGIIFGSMVWIGWAWATQLVQYYTGYGLWHAAFAICYALCVYNFFRAVTLDPGTCPKPANDAELKSIIEELTSEGRLNGQTFCISCMGRKALRSKHCRVCDKCVARFDHHCPWVWNCVGVNNHRQFIIFVTTLVFGIIAYDYLAYAYFSEHLTRLPDADLELCSFPEFMCTAGTHAPFVLAITAWCTLQLSWTIILWLSQLWQIARQMTTLEVTNLGRYGYMGSKGTSLATQMGHSHAQRGAGAGGDDLGDSVGPRHTHRHAGGCMGCANFLLNVLGLDRFTKGKAVDGLARAGKASNPFNVGVVGNCRDFWTGGRELGVDYQRLYAVPPEGWAERKRRWAEQDSGRRPEGLLAKMGLRMGGGRSREGYLPVRMDDQV
ncbi:ankyrin [Auricularia subglabra TFB-10046 SS5]|nr:ankyrin [Auricularia subglabra TFB-10046 SS5]